MQNVFYPKKQGLYDPAFEHESCGIGFMAHLKGIRSLMTAVASGMLHDPLNLNFDKCLSQEAEIQQKKNLNASFLSFVKLLRTRSANQI